MKKHLCCVAAVVAALLVSLPAAARGQGVTMFSDETLQLRLDYWFNEMDSMVKVTSGAMTGTDIEAFDTLGMDVHKQTLVPVVASFSRFGFRLEGWSNLYEGDKYLDADVWFNGVLYPAGDHVQSKFKIENYDMRLSVDLLAQKKMDLGPIAGIRYQRLQARLENLTTSERHDEVMHAPMPYLGGTVRFNLSPYVSLGGELGAMNLNLSEQGMRLSSYVDACAYAEIRITPMFAIVGGARYLTAQVYAEKDEVEFRFREHIQGLFAGAALIF